MGAEENNNQNIPNQSVPSGRKIYDHSAASDAQALWEQKQQERVTVTGESSLNLGYRKSSSLNEKFGEAVVNTAGTAVKAYARYATSGNNEVGEAFSIMRDIAYVAGGVVAREQLKIEKTMRRYNNKAIAKIEVSGADIKELAQLIRANNPGMSNTELEQAINSVFGGEDGKAFKLSDDISDTSKFHVKTGSGRKGDIDLNRRTVKLMQKAGVGADGNLANIALGGNKIIRAGAFQRIQMRGILKMKGAPNSLKILAKTANRSSETASLFSRKYRLAKNGSGRLGMALRDRFRLTGLGLRKLSGGLIREQNEMAMAVSFYVNMIKRVTKTVRLGLSVLRTLAGAVGRAAKLAAIAATRAANTKLLQNTAFGKGTRKVQEATNNYRRRQAAKRDKKVAKKNARKQRFRQSRVGRFIRDPFGVSTRLRNAARRLGQTKFVRGGRRVIKGGKAVAGGITGIYQLFTDPLRFIAGKLAAGALYLLSAIASFLMPIILTMLAGLLIVGILFSLISSAGALFDLSAMKGATPETEEYSEDESADDSEDAGLVTEKVDVQEEAINALSECYKTFNETIDIYKGMYNGNVSVVYNDIKDPKVYKKYPAAMEFQESTNLAEIMSMANAYFDYDLQAAGKDDVVRYVTQLFNGSHTVDVSTSERIVTTDDGEGGEFNYTVTDATISVTTYFFPEIFKCPLLESMNLPYEMMSISGCKAYQISAADAYFIAQVCMGENGISEAAMAAECSLICNLTDKYGYPDPVSFIKKPKSWFQVWRDGSYATQSPGANIVSMVQSIVTTGCRTLPPYIDEHDQLSDIASVNNNGMYFDKHEYSKYQPHVTKLTQGKMADGGGATWTFYCFPAPPESGCDPFGYTSRPDDWEKYENSYTATGVNSRGSTQANSPEVSALGTAAYNHSGASSADAKKMIALMADIVQKQNSKYRIKNSVVIAQMIYESGWFTTGLAKKANNVLGMNVEGLVVPGTRWNSYQSTVVMNGRTWKAYRSIEDCVDDYCAVVAYKHPYLKNNNNLQDYQRFLDGYTPKSDNAMSGYQHVLEMLGTYSYLQNYDGKYITDAKKITETKISKLKKKQIG